MELILREYGTEHFPAKKCTGICTKDVKSLINCLLKTLKRVFFVFTCKKLIKGDYFVLRTTIIAEKPFTKQNYCDRPTFLFYQYGDRIGSSLAQKECNDNQVKCTLFLV